MLTLTGSYCVEPCACLPMSLVRRPLTLLNYRIPSYRIHSRSCLSTTVFFAVRGAVMSNVVILHNATSGLCCRYRLRVRLHVSKITHEAVDRFGSNFGVHRVVS